jgi:hypothetical protein
MLSLRWPYFLIFLSGCGWSPLTESSPASNAVPTSACLVNGKVYSDGADVPNPEDCNRCWCSHGDVACTLIGCPQVCRDPADAGTANFDCPAGMVCSARRGQVPQSTEPFDAPGGPGRCRPLSRVAPECVFDQEKGTYLYPCQEGQVCTVDSRSRLVKPFIGGLCHSPLGPCSASDSNMDLCGLGAECRRRADSVDTGVCVEPWVEQ